MFSRVQHKVSMVQPKDFPPRKCLVLTHQHVALCHYQFLHRNILFNIIMYSLYSIDYNSFLNYNNFLNKNPSAFEDRPLRSSKTAKFRSYIFFLDFVSVICQYGLITSFLNKSSIGAFWAATVKIIFDDRISIGGRKLYRSSYKCKSISFHTYRFHFV